MNSNASGCLAAIFGIKAKPLKQQAVDKYPIPSLPAEQFPMSTDFPHFASRGNLLTNAEANFFHVLHNMTRDSLIVFPHVALRDLISVVDGSEYFTYYNKIKQKQVDFVLCDPKTLRPIFAIELDDSSHQRPDRITRDEFVDKVFSVSKIPLVRVPVSYSYSTETLGKLFKDAIEQSVHNKNEAPIQGNTVENPPFCPRHGVRMILRTAQKTGEKFWGCPNYPTCREVIKLQTKFN
jgi:hypothetical protein